MEAPLPCLADLCGCSRETHPAASAGCGSGQWLGCALLGTSPELGHIVGPVLCCKPLSPRHVGVGCFLQLSV